MSPDFPRLYATADYINDTHLNSITSTLGHKLEESSTAVPGALFYDGRLHYCGPFDLSFDLIGAWRRHCKANYALGNEPLARALGIKKRDASINIVELTAGTGKDSLLILAFGGHLVSYERHPLVWGLLYDARRRLFDELGQELPWQLHFGDARQFQGQAQAAYFDPMYPEKRKSALPRKEMQLFHGLVGPDRDDREVGQWALSNFHRLVVKRPLKGEPLLSGINTSFKGKSTRYDLYVC